MIAAQLRLIRDDVETPTPDFLRTLERAVLTHRASRRRRPRGISRGRFVGAALRTAAAAAVGAGIEAATTPGPAPGRHELVSGHGHWYDVAAADELASGQIKPFSAGGILGFLVNDGGRLHAISSICTHMGCRLKPTPHDARLHCLCHDSWFRLDGSIIRGTAREPLPRIDLRIAGGRVYARGTSERL